MNPMAEILLHAAEYYLHTGRYHNVKHAMDLVVDFLGNLEKDRPQVTCYISLLEVAPENYLTPYISDIIKMAMSHKL